MKDYIQRLLESAKESGMEAAEAYFVQRENFSATRINGELSAYESNQTLGLCLRGLINGRLGYASTEALDEEAVGQLIRGVEESATLCESPDEQFLYQGGDETPELELCDPANPDPGPNAKLRLAEETEAASRAADGRIATTYNVVETGKHTVRIANTYGMDRSFTETYAVLASEADVREDGDVSTGSGMQYARSVARLDAEKTAREGVERAVQGLHAAPVPSGKYRVIFWNEAMVSLLGAFCSIFSAETEQKGLSLLGGKLGQSVAAPCVTLTDDPLRPDCMNSRPFDAEGAPSAKHVLLEKGVFRTFLHNLKTARKAGVQTTANASKAGYSSPVHVAPSNLYFEPGDASFEKLLEEMGDGVVVTSVSGLHAGANPLSGDFSLLSKGYTVKNGKRDRPVERITVAGNYYDLLKNIRAFADDLRFPDGALGSPSAYAGEMTLSGQG